jgi:hypothetical protein
MATVPERNVSRTSKRCPTVVTAVRTAKQLASLASRSALEQGCLYPYEIFYRLASRGGYYNNNVIIRGGFRLCEALGKRGLARPLLYKFV